jgi:hypothetical protein
MVSVATRLFATHGAFQINFFEEQFLNLALAASVKDSAEYCLPTILERCKDATNGTENQPDEDAFTKAPASPEDNSARK